MVWLFAYFPVRFNAHPARGAEHRAYRLIDVARSFRTQERDIYGCTWRSPYTLPYLMTSLRQALQRGLVGMIAAESSS